MVTEWRKVSLGDLGEVVTGKTPPSTEDGCFGSNVPFITPSDFDGRRLIFETNRFLSKKGLDLIGRFVIPPGAVMVTCIGSDMGKVALSVALSATNQQINTLVVKPGIDAEYVYYNLSLRKDEFRQKAGGSAQPILNKGHFKQFEILLPPLLEQRAIARVLGALDDKIELNRRMNDTLEVMARALFQSWFVDFEPVRAKAEGRDPGLPPHLADLFPSSFIDSELGEIPEEWNFSKVGAVTDALYDGPHATPAKADNGPVFLGIPNFRRSSLDLTNVRHIAEADFARWTKRVVPKHGDIVFTYEATLGFFALIPPDLRCCLGRRTALVRPEEHRRNSHFLLHWFTSRPFQNYIQSHKQPGSTVDRIWLTQFPDFPVIEPSERLVQQFERFGASCWAKIHANQLESRTLTELRDTLLPKLICGELRVKDAERAVECVV